MDPDGQDEINDIDQILNLNPNQNDNIFNAFAGAELPPLVNFGPDGQLIPPLFNFRFDLLPYLENPNNPGRALLHMLHDRLMEAMYDNQDKEEQAMEVAEATFDTMCRLLQHKEPIDVLFKQDFYSNLFGGISEKQEFFDKMDEFSSATWRVYKAVYQYEDVVVGHVGCSASDQLLHFGMKWSVNDRHFMFMFLDRFGREDRPIPVRP